MGKLIYQDITFDKIKDIINMFGPTMHDYLYCLDLDRDYYCISPLAMERFDLPDVEFADAGLAHSQFVHPDDYDNLMEDLKLMKTGEQDTHDLKYRWLSRNGSSIWINCKGTNIYTEEGGQPKFMIGCINEIGKLPEASNLSGMILERELLNILARVETDALRGYLIRCGIDDFRSICESRGTEYGWSIIKKVSEIITSELGHKDVCYATGRDELTINLYSADSIEDCLDFNSRVRSRVNKFIKDSGYETYFTMCAGILPVEAMKDKNIYDTLMFSAFTLSEARKKGVDELYIYEEEAYEKFVKNRELSRHLRAAVNDGYKGFKLLYQPIVDSNTRKITGAEALLRFDSPKTGPIMPLDFIPILEHTTLIVPVGRWVIKQALSFCKEIRKTIPTFKISVNLSYVQIQKSHILDDILSILADFEMPSNAIIIEITESGSIEISGKARTFCEELKTYGIPVALDDFGTGYSNFSYLMDIAPHSLKIDRSFTLKALKNEKDFNILSHMAKMIHSVDAKYVIEGIETEEEMERISGVDPDYIQGYLFGRPLSPEDFKKLI